MGLFKRLPAVRATTDLRGPAPPSLLDPDLVHLVAGLDLLDDVHAGGDLTEHGVLAVEVGRGLARVDDEELGAAGVLPRVGHREGAGVVDLLLATGLALDVEAGAAHPIAHRAAALDDEVRDHPVKGEAVIEGA